MVRGFVTLATSNIKYYKMALNMLKSFRLHNPGVPFAIVCDRENEITAEFDDVVILEKANGDYRDKFSLLVNAPYDENIFIEPDCLIYRNLDFFWELLSKLATYLILLLSSLLLFCLFQRIFANKIGGNKQLLLSVGMKEGCGYRIHHSVLFCKSGVQEFRPNLAGFSVPSRLREFNSEYSRKSVLIGTRDW